MVAYKNIDGDSSIIAYEIGSDYIRVQFSNGKVHLWNYRSAGSANIEQMKKLAQIGNGLNSFIMRVVKNLYVR